MCNIARLGLIASRLLIALTIHGEEWMNGQPKTKIMEVVGTGREETFYAARAELERLGFIQVERNNGRRAVVSLSLSLSSAAGGVRLGDEHNLHNIYNNILLGGSLDGSTGSFADDHPQETGAVLPTLNGGGTTHSMCEYPQQVGVVIPTASGGGTPLPPTVNGGGVGEPPTESVGGILSLVDRCRLADAMDDSGAITSTKSPFSVRRAAQIPLVQEAYKLYFPDDPHALSDRNARNWLSWNENSSLDVVEGLRDLAFKKPGVPIAYINKAIKGERSRAEAPPTTFLSSAVPPRPAVGAEAYVPGGDLPKPSPEYLAQVQAAAQRFNQMRLERGWAE